MGSTGAVISQAHLYFIATVRKSAFQPIIKHDGFHAHRTNSSSQLPRSRPGYQSQL